MNAISIIKPQWIEEVINSYIEDDWAKDKLTAALVSPNNIPDVQVVEGLIRYK